MFVFIGSGLFIGGLLGARLTVVALVPAATLALGIAALAWAGHARLPDWSPLDLIALIVFLQIGYLGGAGVRLFVGPPPVVGQGRHCAALDRPLPPRSLAGGRQTIDR